MKIPTLAFTLFKRVATSALVLLTANSSFSQEAGGVDAFLATPVPKGPISEATAKAAVEKGNALAATAANRTSEIQAYLIPFQRVLGTPADQQPSASSAPAVIPRPKPFLIFKSSDGVAESFKADTFTTEGDFMIAQSSDGKKGMFQKNRFETQLPWYQDEEMDLGNLDLETLALRYKVSIPLYPAIKAALQSEMERIQAIDNKHHQAVANKAAALEESVARILAQSKSYSAENPYSREELAGLLLNAEAVRKKAPDHAEKIDAAIAPFRAHFENLLANRVFVAGSWQNKADVDARNASRQVEQEVMALEKNVHFEISAVSLSNSEMRIILGTLLVIAIGVFGWGLHLLTSKPTLPLRALGALVCMAPATLGIYSASRLAPNQSNAPSFASEKPTGLNKALRVVYLASKTGNQPASTLDRRITLRESDLNSFLKEYLVISGAPVPADWGIYRTDLAVQLQPDSVSVWELSHFKGKKLRVRYDLKTDGVGSGMKIADSKVTIGSFSVPKPIARMMLNHLTTELAKIKMGGSVLDSFTVTRLTDGETDLTSSAKPVSTVVAKAP